MPGNGSSCFVLERMAMRGTGWEGQACRTEVVGGLQNLGFVGLCAPGLTLPAPHK